MAVGTQFIVSWLGKKGMLGIRPATVTAAAGAATLNAAAGTVTSESLTTAGAAEYTLTLTNSMARLGDHVNWSVDPLSSAGTPGQGGCKITNGTMVFTVTNLSGSAFDGPIAIKYMLIRAA